MSIGQLVKHLPANIVSRLCVVGPGVAEPNYTPNLIQRQLRLQQPQQVLQQQPRPQQLHLQVPEPQEQ